MKETKVVYGSVPDDPTVDYDVTFCSQGTYSFVYVVYIDCLDGNSCLRLLDVGKGIS